MQIQKIELSIVKKRGVKRELKVKKQTSGIVVVDEWWNKAHCSEKRERERERELRQKWRKIEEKTLFVSVSEFGKLGFIFSAGVATMWKPSFSSRDLNKLLLLFWN